MSYEDKARHSRKGKEKTKLVVTAETPVSTGHQSAPEFLLSPAPDHGHDPSPARSDRPIERCVRFQEPSPGLPVEASSGECDPDNPALLIDNSTLPEDTDQDKEVGPADQNLRNGLIFPETIDYELLVKCDDLSADPLRKTLFLNDPNAYRDIDEGAVDLVKKLCKAPPNAEDLHFRGGHCIEVRNDVARPQYAIANRVQWQNMCRNLLRDFALGEIRHCKLLISREYSLLQVHQSDLGQASDSDDENETTHVTEKVHSLRLPHKLSRMKRENIYGQEYLSSVDFNAFTSRHMIQAVIHNSKGLAKLKKDKDRTTKLIDDISESAKKLFTLYVLDQVDMKCLKKLLDRGFHDNNLLKHGGELLANGGESYVCCWHHNFQPKTLNQRLKIFSVFNLKRSGHSRVSRDLIIPILPVALTQSERSSDISKTHSNTASHTRQEGITADEIRRDNAVLGNGAHSTVYKVRIDPSHNGISKNRDELFALKVITSEQCSPKEERMLDEIESYKSPHLVKRLVSWTQDKKHWILFPLAECNLAEYMKRHRLSGEGNDMIWLLEQFYGLADALEKIHAPKSNGEEQPNTTGRARSGSTDNQLRPPGGGQDTGKLKDSYIGWHHDVKPQNILCFNNADTKQKTFQLCDYGSSKINKFRTRSNPTATPRGTPTYDAPETAWGRLSRPSDTWALGCVFLEIVTWAIENFEGVDRFYNAREGKRVSGTSTIDHAFWEMSSDNRAKLREKVIEHIRHLEDKAKETPHQLFREVLELIILMLCVDKDERIKMSLVRRQLSSIVAEAEANLKQQGRL